MPDSEHLQPLILRPSDEPRAPADDSFPVLLPQTELAPPARSGSARSKPRRGSTRSKARRRKARRVKRARIALGGAVFVLLLVGVSAYAALAAQAHLVEGRTELTKGKHAAESLDFTGAKAALLRADVELTAARHLLRFPLLRLAAHVPVAGPSVRAANDLAEGAVIAVRGARAAFAVGAPLQSADGHVSMSALGDAALWDRIDNAARDAERAFAQARTLAENAPTRFVIGRIATARTQFLRQAADAETAARKLRSGLVLARAMLGFKGARRNLIVVQDGTQPKGTGGLIEGLLTMSVHDGHAKLDEVFDDTPAATPESDPNFDKAVDPFFHANEAPDVPTVSRGVASLYERLSGKRVDSVILVDANFLANLLQLAGGSIAIQGEKLRAAELVHYLTQDLYVQHPVLLDRDRFRKDLSAQLFSRLVNDRISPRAVATALGLSIREKHLLLWSSHAAEQTAVADLGFDWSFATPKDAALLAVVGNAPDYVKLAPYEMRTLDYSVALDRTGRAQATLGVDLYNAVLDVRALPRRLLDGKKGVVRQIVTAWGLASTNNVASLTAAPGEHARADFTAAYQTEPGMYRLHVYRQPGLLADHVVVRVTVPAGSKIEATSAGFSVDGTTARWDGNPKTDTDVWVRYTH